MGSKNHKFGGQRSWIPSLAQETPISGFGELSELSEEEHVKIQRLGPCQSMSLYVVQVSNIFLLSLKN